MPGPQENEPPRAQPLEFDERYRRAIATVEDMPQNQSGADKTWVYETFRRIDEHFLRATRKD